MYGLVVHLFARAKGICYSYKNSLKEPSQPYNYSTIKGILIQRAERADLLGMAGVLG